MDTDRADRLNFPTSHALYGTGPDPKDADALLMLETPVPYLPPKHSPRPGAKIIWVEPDPVFSRFKSVEHQADLWLSVTSGSAARAIYDAVTMLLSRSDMNRISERLSVYRRRKERLRRTTKSSHMRLVGGRRCTPGGSRIKWVRFLVRIRLFWMTL